VRTSEMQKCSRLVKTKSVIATGGMLHTSTQTPDNAFHNRICYFVILCGELHSLKI